jgi:hypothetical protein
MEFKGGEVQYIVTNDGQMVRFTIVTLTIVDFSHSDVLRSLQLRSMSQVNNTNHIAQPPPSIYFLYQRTNYVVFKVQ